jgi:hypothetical protein
MAKTNGHRPKQEIMPAESVGLPDLDRLTPEERDRITKAYMAGVGAAAAMQTDMSDINVPEYYGRSPNDLRRQPSTLPRPAQGLTRRPSQRPVTPDGDPGPSAE